MRMLWSTVAAVCLNLTPSSFADKSKPEPELSLEAHWATQPVFKTPESVLYDAGRQVLYVSNINGGPLDKDGNGFISKLSLSGEVETLEWISGLDGPKGMALWNDQLFVADISQIVVIDLISEKIVARHELGGEFLNDLTVSPDGSIFASDSSTNTIYKLDNGQALPLIQRADLGRPNGLLFVDHHLLVASVNNGSVLFLDTTTYEIQKEVATGGRPDGIVNIPPHGQIVTSWDGEIFYVDPFGQADSILDFKAQGVNTADLEYVPDQELVVIPTFFDNRVITFKVRFGG